MTTLDLLKRIRAILAADRDALWHSNVSMASGQIEDAAASELVTQHDQVLAELNILIYAMEPADGVLQAVAYTYTTKGAQP